MEDGGCCGQQLPQLNNIQVAESRCVKLVKGLGECQPSGLPRLQRDEHLEDDVLDLNCAEVISESSGYLRPRHVRP